MSTVEAYEVSEPQLRAAISIKEKKSNIFDLLFIMDFGVWIPSPTRLSCLTSRHVFNLPLKKLLNYSCNVGVFLELLIITLSILFFRLLSFEKKMQLVSLVKKSGLML